MLDHRLKISASTIIGVYKTKLTINSRSDAEDEEPKSAEFFRRGRLAFWTTFSLIVQPTCRKKTTEKHRNGDYKVKEGGKAAVDSLYLFRNTFLG